MQTINTLTTATNIRVMFSRFLLVLLVRSLCFLRTKCKALINRKFRRISTIKGPNSTEYEIHDGFVHQKIIFCYSTGLSYQRMGSVALVHGFILWISSRSKILGILYRTAAKTMNKTAILARSTLRRCVLSGWQIATYLSTVTNITIHTVIVCAIDAPTHT